MGSFSSIISIIGIFLALILWKITFEHNIAICFYALTKNIAEQLKSIFSALGKENPRELAIFRIESFEREVLPYLNEWRIAAEKFNVVFNEEKYKKYSANMDELLNIFKDALFKLSEPSGSKAKLPYELLMYGQDENYNQKFNQFFIMLDQELKELIKHPYKSFFDRLLNPYKDWLPHGR